MLNKIIIQGRLTKEPELRTTQSGVSVASFTLACDRERNREEVDFINCVAWRHTGEFVSKYFRKGQLVLVSGSLQNREWKDRDGNNRVSAEVICESVYFCESKKASFNTAPSSDVVYEELPNDDDGDLPF